MDMQIAVQYLQGLEVEVKLSGNMIKRLMRRHKVTMRQIKAKFQITLKRIREVRARGVEGFNAEEWFFILTGKWPDAAWSSKEA